MKIKKGDKVKILTGKNRGKIGKVLQVFPSRGKVSVEGINLLYKHLRPRKQGEAGQRIQFPAPLDISNIQLVCPKCGKLTRVGYKKIKLEVKDSVENDGKKTSLQKLRICKKCKEVI